jgi:predicted permease
MAALIRGHERAEGDVRAEMAAHLEMEIDENIRRGMSPQEARRQAMLSSGGLTQAAERVHEQRGLPWLEGIVADTRFAVRHFRRTPLSTATMIAVLSLGIGMNVVMFTVLNSLATMPAPGMLRDESVVRIRGIVKQKEAAGAQPRTMSWPEVQQYAARPNLFTSVAAYADESANVDLGDGANAPTTVGVTYTTPNYFDVIGVRPSLGSVPSGDAGSVRMTTAPTAMISHAMWQQRFGGARDVIGRTLRVNGTPVQIVGVASPRFVGTEGGNALTIWVPLAAYPTLQKRSAATFASYDSAFLHVAARLQPGITPKAATPVVAGLAARAVQQGPNGAASQITSKEDPADNSAIGSADIAPMLASNSRVSERNDLLVSGFASGALAFLVLLITCTNVSALMVGLAVARRKEIGVRLSLGAPRTRLVRQLLTETVLLSLIAAGIGLFVTNVAIQLLGANIVGVQLVVDWRVTVATCAIAIVTGMLFGVSPALHATRVSLGEVLKSSSTSVVATRSRLQRALVILQITLTQPLLVGLGVVVVSMVTDMSSHTPLSVTERIAEVEFNTWSGRVSNEERVAAINATVDRIRAMPGVTAVMPMQLGTNTAPVSVLADDRLPGIIYQPAMQAHLEAAPDGYFNAYEIPIVRGRDFDASEHAHKSDDPMKPLDVDAVIIGTDLAHKFWGDANPIGRRLEIAGSGSTIDAVTVVGIVDEAAAGPSEENGFIRLFVPYSTMNTGVIARTSGPAQPLLDDMRKSAAEAAPRLPITRVETMAQREAIAHHNMMFMSSGIAIAGLLALLLSAIGLYAVVSFMVSQRTREIGIRTVLGAQQSQVVRMFFGKGLSLSATGLILGLPLSIIATRIIIARLHWPMTRSPLIGVAIAVVVLVVASVAVWIPSRRASAIDPLVALRTE